MSKLFTYIKDVDLQILLALTHHDLYTMYHTSNYAKQLIDTHPVLSKRLNDYLFLITSYKRLITENINPNTRRKIQPGGTVYSVVKQDIERKLRYYNDY